MSRYYTAFDLVTNCQVLSLVKNSGKIVSRKFNEIL